MPCASVILKRVVFLHQFCLCPSSTVLLSQLVPPPRAVLLASGLLGAAPRRRVGPSPAAALPRPCEDLRAETVLVHPAHILLYSRGSLGPTRHAALITNSCLPAPLEVDRLLAPRAPPLRPGLVMCFDKPVAPVHRVGGAGIGGVTPLLRYAGGPCGSFHLPRAPSGAVL